MEIPGIVLDTYRIWCYNIQILKHIGATIG